MENADLERFIRLRENVNIRVIMLEGYSKEAFRRLRRGG